MGSDEDPEQKIAELERSLSEAVATSEVAAVAERPRTSMRIGWIVLGLMVLGLIIGGGAIVSSRLAAGHRPVAGNPTAPAVVGGGGSVPGNSAAPSSRPSLTPIPTTPPTTAVTVSNAPPGGAFSVAGVGNNRTFVCNDSIASISGVGNTVILTGYCARVDISGVNNVVTIDETGAIDVSGMNNKVVFHSGTPELNQSGFDNTVQQG